MSLFTKLGNEIASPVDAAGNPRAVENVDMQRWMTEVERATLAFQAGGGIIFPDKATMDGTLTYAANQMAWVMGDATAGNNGIYRKVGASGSGSWVRLGDLPFSFIMATNAGAGTPDAIVATSLLPIPAADGAAMISLNVAVGNTGSPVTVSFNGGAPLTIKTMSGNDVAPGGLTAGMIVTGFKAGSTFRMITDQASAAIQAAAEAAQAAAEGAAAGLNLPTIGSGDAGKSLVVKQTEDGYELLDDRDVVRVEDRTALKALDGVRTPVAIVYGEGGRNGVFVFVSGDQSALVTLDPSEILYVAPASDTSGANGVWSRQRPEYIDVRWAGAVNSSVADQATPLQAAIDLAQEIDIPVFLEPKASYRIDAGLTCKHGVAPLESKRYNVRFICNDAEILPTNSIIALSIVPRCSLADKLTGRGEAVIDIRGRLTFRSSLDATAKAIKIGSAGYWIRCLETSVVENILVGSFTSGNAVQIIEATRIEFRGLTLRNSQLYIASLTAGGNVGDLHFYNLEITGSTSSQPGLHMYAIGAGPSRSQVTGIRFWSCTFYGGGYRLEARSNGTIRDIWFNSLQIDAGEGDDIAKLRIRSIEASANVNGIHLIAPYVVNHDNLAIDMDAVSGEMSDVRIVNGQFGMITPDSNNWNCWVRANRVNGFCFSGNIFNQITDQPENASIIRIVNCQDFIIDGNVGIGNKSIDRGIIIDSNCDRFTVINNRLSADTQILNQSSAMDQIVANNRADA